MEKAIEWGYWEVNPARVVKLPRMQLCRETPVLTYEELAMLPRSLWEPVEALAIASPVTGFRWVGKEQLLVREG
jgi:hypothetical protein